MLVEDLWEGADAIDVDVRFRPFVSGGYIRMLLKRLRTVWKRKNASNACVLDASVHMTARGVDEERDACAGWWSLDKTLRRLLTLTCA